MFQGPAHTKTGEKIHYLLTILERYVDKEYSTYLYILRKSVTNVIEFMEFLIKIHRSERTKLPA